MLYEPFPYKRSVQKTAAQKAFSKWIHEQPCIVTGRYGDGGRFTRSHWILVPLIEELHQHDYGKDSVERLGHGGFYERHGIDLEIAALHTLVRYLETERGR